jgi:hypothetical protein
MRTDIPDLRFRKTVRSAADGSILSYLRAEPGMTLVAYSPLRKRVRRGQACERRRARRDRV